MEENKIKNIIIGVLIIIIFVLGGLIGYIYLLSYNNSANDEVKIEEEETNEDSIVNLDELEKVIDNELYVLFGFNSLNDISNQRKLSLVFNLLESEYTHSSDDVNSSLDSVSRKKVEEVFGDTVLSNLGIDHQNFDVYEVNDSFYNRNYNYFSKRNLYIPGKLAKKVVNYVQDGNRYTIDIKYLFVNNADSGDRGQFAYGSYSNEDEKIVEIYRYNDNFEFQLLVSDLQKYLDDNYDDIKDKLDTYHYVFEVNNNEIKLVDFSIVD